MDTSDKIRVRIKMLGGRIDDGVLEYLAQKSLLAAKGFCNVDEFPDEAETFLAEWAAADYLTETDGYSKQWERMRKDAEAGLLRFRRIMW